MTLHEAIVKVLRDNKRLMSVDDIASLINLEGYYERNDREPLTGGQVSLRVKNYPYLFENINGIIVLTDDENWKSIITSYWYLKEILRGILSSSDMQFVIAALFFYKRLIDINERPGRRYPINVTNLHSSIDRLIDGGKQWSKSLEAIDKFSISPDGIFSNLSKELLKLDSAKREGIQSIISRVHTISYSDFEFGNIYEYLLYLSSKEYFGYESSTPESIRGLIPKLLDISENMSVYDPVSGLGGLLSKVYNKNKNVSIKGSEINRRTAELGNMNLMMYGLSYTSSIVVEDCFEEISTSIKYDYIIGDLPINGITNSFERTVLYEKFKIPFLKSGKSFSSLALFCYYKLSNIGRAVVTVSDSFLTKGGTDKSIRKILIDNDAVEAIISLPKGTYRPYTESKASILIINKNKPYHLVKKIKFIKVPPIEESKKSILLNNKQIVDEYFEEVTNSKFTQVIDVSDIDSDLSLSAEKYDIQFSLAKIMLKEGTGREMRDLARVISGKQPSKDELIRNGELPIIKIENLSKDILDINLNVVSSELDLVNNSRKYFSSIISQQCILIAKIGDNLKPTIFKPSQQLPEILIHSGVIALVPKEGINIDLEYLYYQLNSSFIEEQINTKRSGALIPYINKVDIEKVIIPFESLDLQKKFINTQKANLIAEESKRFEGRKKALGYEEDTREAEVNIVRTITHQLKHSLSGVDAAIQKMASIVDKNKIGDTKEYKEDDSILIKEEGFEIPENESLEQTVKNALRKSSLLNKILTDVEKAIHLELRFSKENIHNLFNEFKKEFKSISIEVKGEKNIELNLSKSHIEDLFNTLINNAIQHSGLSKEKLRIVFSIKKEENTIKIEYRNNGKPMGISEKEFKSIATKSHSSTGTGVGGYYINKIVEAHSGIMDIEADIKSGVRINFELPLKIDNNE